MLNFVSVLRELVSAIHELTAEIKRLRVELRQRERETGRAPAVAPRAAQPRSRSRPASRPTALTPRSIPVSKPVQKAATYLNKQGFTLRRYHDQEKDSADERNLSKFLGDRHDASLAPLYSLLRDVDIDVAFELDLSESSQREIGDSVQLCQFLSSVNYLSDYNYARNARVLTGALTKDGDAYIRGRWLEQYIRRQLVSGFGRAQMGYSLIMNPYLLFRDGQECELDLFLVERDKPMWIECTTAKDPRERLHKMGALRKRLSIPTERTLLVVTGMSNRRIRDLSRNAPLTITNVNDFPSYLSDSLE